MRRLSLLLLLTSCQVPAEEAAEDTAPAVRPGTDLRQALRQRALAGPVRAAADALEARDPHVRLSWLRGHVDSYSARPRKQVPAYARRALSRFGRTPLEEEAPRVEVLGPGSTRALQPAPAEVDSEQLPQGSAEDVKPVLAEFLRDNAALFALDPALLDAALPNLELVDFGRGRHFRRAVFEQKVGETPVLDGRLVVLFDLSWNVIAVSKQIVTQEKVRPARAATLGEGQATQAALAALRAHQGRFSGSHRLGRARLGLDLVRGAYGWQVEVRDDERKEEFLADLDAATGELLSFDDTTARFSDAKVKYWNYTGGDMTAPFQATATGVYTHDDDTLVHDFFYVANDDRNYGGTSSCTLTGVASNTTGAAYGTTTSATVIRPSVRTDRDFSSWLPSSSHGAFGETHVYYWGREYMQWQKQAMVDLGVLTTGSFNDFTHALIIVNACDDDAGHYSGSFAVSIRDNAGEGLGTIILPEVCRSGNPSCSATDYADSNSGNLYTYEGGGGYHFPGVIHHELNHFVLIEYFGVTNSLNCTTGNEKKYFQEGGLGRALPQIFWDSRFDVGYLPDTTNKLFRSNGTSGKVHDPAKPSSLNHLDNFACGTDGGDPYGWGGVVVQPLWEIYHGQRVENGALVPMGKPAADLGMIKAMYYAADMTAASTIADRSELANRFMEFWELFSTALPTTKADWCATWEHHGLGDAIDPDFCS